MNEIFETYGYYLEKVQSTTMPGADGLRLMGEAMERIRNHPPREIGGVKVAQVLDILKGTKTDAATGKVEKLAYPASDVLYFAMEGGHFVCVRPSGTEPKIKAVRERQPPGEGRGGRAVGENDGGRGETAGG
jgi:phosphoglucomutase